MSYLFYRYPSSIQAIEIYEVRMWYDMQNKKTKTKNIKEIEERKIDEQLNK